MNLNQHKKKVIEIVVEPMISFMEDWDDCDYTTVDVETSAIDCGLKECGDDITEEWREW